MQKECKAYEKIHYDDTAKQDHQPKMLICKKNIRHMKKFIITNEKSISCQNLSFVSTTSSDWCLSFKYQARNSSYSLHMIIGTSTPLTSLQEKRLLVTTFSSDDKKSSQNEVV